MDDRKRRQLTFLVFLAMTMAILPSPAIGVIATFLIDDLGVTRGDIGTAVGAFGLVGGLGALAMGRLVDRSAARLSVLLVFGVSSLGLATVASAPGRTALIAGMAVAGLGQALGTSATNRAVSESLEPRWWGSVAGIKESGVPLGGLVAGMWLPPMALLLGWRLALVGLIAPALGGAYLSWVLLPSRFLGSHQESASPSGMPGFVRRAAFYAFAIGFGSNPLFTFIPLMGEERLGMAPSLAGLVIALASLSAVFGRLAWGPIADRAARPDALLGLIAALSIAGVGLLAVGGIAHHWPFWAGACLIGLSAFAWTPVVMVLLLRLVPAARTGRATSVVTAGFGLGLGAGPPVFGRLVDTSGSYAWGLAMSAMAFACAAATVLARRSGATPQLRLET